MLEESNYNDKRTVVIVSVSVAFVVLLSVSVSWLFIREKMISRSKGNYYTLTTTASFIISMHAL
jgi:hypothetical protein